VAAIQSDLFTIPKAARAILRLLVEQLQSLDERVAVLDREIARRAREDADARRLMTIPGIGRSQRRLSPRWLRQPKPSRGTRLCGLARPYAASLISGASQGRTARSLGELQSVRRSDGEYGATVNETGSGKPNHGQAPRAREIELDLLRELRRRVKGASEARGSVIKETSECKGRPTKRMSLILAALLYEPRLFHEDVGQARQLALEIAKRLVAWKCPSTNLSNGASARYTTSRSAITM
jgi:hypothetical protein